MRLLGIDYGKKRVGIALSDDQGILAFPKAVLPNDKFLMRDLTELITGHSVGLIVLGESRDFQMNENPIMSRIKLFRDELARETGLEIVYEPELLSSHEASKAMHAGGKTDMIDASAATIILQSYIDRKKHESRGNQA